MSDGCKHRHQVQGYSLASDDTRLPWCATRSAVTWRLTARKLGIGLHRWDTGGVEFQEVGIAMRW